MKSDATQMERRFNPAGSWRAKFTNAEQFVISIPGGKFGALPLAGPNFEGGVRITNLGQGVSIRAISSYCPMVFRSEFDEGDPPSVAYILPSLSGGASLLDGFEVNGNSIAARGGGYALLATSGAYEIGTVTVCKDVLRDTSVAILGYDYNAALMTPTTIIHADSAKLALLRDMHRAAGALLSAYTPEDLNGIALPGVKVIRDGILATLISALGEIPLRPDHKARQQQTKSMEKIDFFIKSNQDDHIGLQDMCTATGLALRTIETIIRTRTGLSAIAYLRLNRLSSARRRLSNPHNGTTVTGVALDSGFLHLGRFSQHYRAAYGESPRETLKKHWGK